MNIPDGAKLTYIVAQEAWWAEANNIAYPEVMIVCSARGGGCHWEFTAHEHEVRHGTAVQFRIFGDAWISYSQVPELFFQLAARGDDIDTVAALIVVLESVGFVDKTDRVNPYAPQPPTVHAVASQLEIEAG